MLINTIWREYPEVIRISNEISSNKYIKVPILPLLTALGWRGMFQEGRQTQMGHWVSSHGTEDDRRRRVQQQMSFSISVRVCHLFYLSSSSSKKWRVLDPSLSTSFASVASCMQRLFSLRQMVPIIIGTIHGGEY